MKVWLVYCDKLLGRILARDEEHALKMAAVYWGRGRSYKVKQIRERSTTMRTTKMIQGARGLAAALAGAPAFVKDDTGQWRKSSAKSWRRFHDDDSPFAGRFGVRTDDARRVLR